MTYKQLQLPVAVISALITMGLGGCSDDGDSAPTETPAEPTETPAEPTNTPTPTPTPTPAPVIELPEALTFSGEVWPEDVIVFDNRAFVSNFVYGGIQAVDLTQPTAPATQFVPEETGSNLTSWWGLKPDAERNWILVVANAFYTFDGNVTAQGELRAYDADTGVLKKSWKLPIGAVGNSLALGGDGAYYIGDIGPTARIIRVAPDNGQVTVWKEDATTWNTAATGGFGLGGMDYNSKDAFYAVFGGAMWRVPVKSDGSAGTLEKVTITLNGQAFESVFADGMSWAGDDTLYYAQNDVFQAGSQGTLFRLELTAPAAGTLSADKSGLKDPSGVFATTLSGARYVFVNESQYGHLFGVDEGSPELPFRVLVFEL